MDNPVIAALMRDKSMNLEQKLLSFLMMSRPEHLPDNPNVPDHTSVGNTIKRLVNSGEISLKFNSNGILDVTQLN